MFNAHQQYFFAGNFSDRDLTKAIFTEADLVGCNFDNTCLQGADFRGSNLVESSFTGADLREAIFDMPVFVENLHEKMWKAVSSDDGVGLDMRFWHTSCGTSHCRAGWAVTLAGEEGRNLEKIVGTGVAGAIIYITSCPEMSSMVNFFDSNQGALENIYELYTIAILARTEKIKDKKMLKGLEGGNCNVTACQSPGALHFNKSTRAYYCQSCANHINWPGGREDSMRLYGRELLCETGLEILS